MLFPLDHRSSFNNYQNVSSPRSVIALAPNEWQDFLPSPQAEELRALLPGAREINPLDQDTDSWAALLDSARPEILITGWKTPPLPAGLPVGPEGLRLLAHTAGSVRRLVPRELIAKGLVVTNWGDSISRTVAEGAMLLLLGALRRAAHWSIAMHQEGGWKDASAVTGSVFGRRVGLHGFGVIARELAKLLRPFGVPISTFSPRVPDAVLAEYGVNRSPSLEDLFGNNDIIVELAALTPTNRNSVTEELLRMIPAGGAFVNVGRGAVVDEDALARVAAEGRIMVGLDVFTVEPLPVDSPLRGLRNVFMMPHLGGPTTDRRRDAGAHAVANVGRFLAGVEPESVVTVDVYDRST